MPPLEAQVAGSTNNTNVTAALLPKVEVIGVGATTLSTQTTTTDAGESTTEEIPLAILTLAVDQKQAQKIINAQTGGAIYFALLGETTKVRTGNPSGGFISIGRAGHSHLSDSHRGWGWRVEGDRTAR